MNPFSKKAFIIGILVLCCGIYSIAQRPSSSWYDIPGFGPESPLTLTSEETFYGVMGAAVLSYTLAEVFGRHDNLHFYQARVGVNNEYFWGYRHVALQNFGVENRVAPWFGFAAEFNMQQWSDRTPTLGKSLQGIGAGVMTYYRWYLLGRRRLSPYIEYGTGLFYGARPFPHNGSNFTFNHSTQLGIEYKFGNKDRLRVGYGQFHQSNNGLLSKNPGYDANGFSLSYSWFWK